VQEEYSSKGGGDTSAHGAAAQGQPAKNWTLLVQSEKTGGQGRGAKGAVQKSSGGGGEDHTEHTVNAGGEARRVYRWGTAIIRKKTGQ